MATTYLLTGDIGGTNSRMGLYDTACSIPLAVKIYSNEEHLPKSEASSPGIFGKNIIAPFLQHCWSTVPGLAKIQHSEIVACLAIAGPVVDNKVKMSNLHGILVDGDAIARHSSSDETYLSRIVVCRVINDFVAQGYGCLTLEPHEIRELTPGSHGIIDPNGPKVCVGAGTGLGECFLTPAADGTYQCFPSEGGHVEFSPRTDEQIKLLKFLMKKFESKHRVSVERVVSGIGLANVYEFLANEYPDKVDPKVHEEFLQAKDQKGKVVSVNAKEGTLCREAIRIMVSTYGAEVGNAAVKFIPTGGLFVTGGLTPKNIHFIEGKDSCFMVAYRDKGRVSPILDRVPLFAVMVEDLGVRGAHKCAVIEYEKLHKFDGFPRGSANESLSKNVGPVALAVVAATAVAVGIALGRKK